MTVISTPTLSHAKFVHDFAKKSKKILVEKPAAIDTKQLKLIANVNDYCFISVCFQRLHDPALKKFISFFQKENQCDLKNISVTVGSDVRLWHPYEDYKDLYACRSDLGGGVLYTECHEIAVVLKILGLPLKSKLIDYSMLKGCDVESELEFDLIYNKVKACFKLNFCTNKHERKIIADFQTSRIELDFFFPYQHTV